MALRSYLDYVNFIRLKNKINKDLSGLNGISPASIDLKREVDNYFQLLVDKKTISSFTTAFAIDDLTYNTVIQYFYFCGSSKVTGIVGAVSEGLDIHAEYKEDPDPEDELNFMDIFRSYARDE